MQPFFGKRFRYRKQSKQEMMKMMRDEERKLFDRTPSPRQRRTAFRIRLGYVLLALALVIGLVVRYTLVKPATWTPPSGQQNSGK